MAYSRYGKRITVWMVLLILFVSVVAHIPLHVIGLAIFSDGFESNNFNAWTGHGGNIATSTAHPHHGTYGATWAAGGTGYCYKTVTGRTTLYMRAYFYFTSVPNTGTYSTILTLVDTNGWLVSEVWFRVSGGATHLWLYSDTDYDETDTGITISPNTWYCVELASYINAAGWNKVWINGTLTSHSVDNSGCGNIIKGYLGAYARTGATYTAYGDCAVIDSSYIGFEVSDSTTPTYSDISASNASSWATKAPLTSPRADGAAAVYGGKLYYCGGYRNNDQDVRPEVYCYDPSTDSWSTRTSMNHATWGHAAAACNGVIYAFGGTTQYTQAYNISTDSWTDKTGLPSNLANVNGLMAVTVGSLIYLFSSQFTYEYNPSTDAFTRKSDAPVARTWATCAYTTVSGEDRIYIIGGSNTGGVMNVNYYYRPTNNDWSSAQTPAPYSAYGGTRDNPVSEGLIYYGFGFDKSTNFYSSLYAYNATANTWSSSLPSGSYERDGLSCGVINSKLYAVGGRNMTTAPYGVDRNEEYTPASVSSLRSFNCKWTDNAGLSGYIFGTNNTGTFVNDSWTVFQANPSWATVTKTLNPSATAVTYQWWANDTGNNWNSTGMQTLTITRNMYPLVMYTIGQGSVVPSNQTFASGTVVDIKAINALGWTFAGWSGGASGSANTTVTMNGPVAVTATFTQNVYTLTVSVMGNGNVYLNNTGPYHYGDVVQLTAVPTVGWSFQSWSGDLIGSTNPTTLVINGDKAVTVTFNQDQYTLTVTTSGSGSVSKVPNQATYIWGTNATLTAIADVGWSFGSWSGDAAGTANPITINMTGNKAVAATFTRNTYTLAVNTVGNGNVNLNNTGPYYYGDVVQLTAVPVIGWSFDHWDGDSIGSTNPTAILMDGNSAVTATFTQNTYTLTVVIVGSGSANRNNTGPYHYGDAVKLTAVPVTGWSFQGWSGDLLGSANPATVLISGNMAVTATFTQNVYTLTVSVMGNGNVYLNNTGPYHYGDVVQLTADPTIGWGLDHWSGDLTGSVNPATISIDDNKVVTATFIQEEYTLTASTVGSGSVNRNNTGPYHYGDVVQLTAVPTDGWSFQSWSGDLLGSANPATILIDRNKAVTATFPQDTDTPFSVVSNSTVTQLAFNSTSQVLEFTVSGPSGTCGFTNVTIAKTLVSDISTLNITFDGNQMSYTVNDLNNSWLIYFTYNHSTHRVIMGFAPQQTKTSSTPSNVATLAVVELSMVISTALAITTKRKRILSNHTKRKH